MARATSSPSSRKRRKRIFKKAKGFQGGQSKQLRPATERVARALQYAYRDRRVRKRDFRALWITRIGNACKQHGISYSRFIAGLKKADIIMNRKILAHLAMHSPDSFKSVIEKVKGVL